jgi:CheY-like chemotaxis protein
VIEGVDRKLLVVEDETIVALELKETLVKLGYAVVGTVNNGPDAIRRAGEERPDLVLMDIHIKGAMDGIEAAEEIVSRYDIPVIYLTAHSDHETISRAIQTLPYGYLVKPFNERSLYSNIEMALHKHQIRKRVQPGADAEQESPAPALKPAPAARPDGRAPAIQPLIDSIADPLFIVNDRMQLVCYNSAFAQVSASLGFPKLKAGAVIYDAVPPVYIGTAEYYQRAFTTGRSEKYERSLGTGEFEYLVSIRKIPPYRDGTDALVIGVIRDMTREKSLKRQNAQLQEEILKLRAHLDGIGRIGASLKTPMREILRLASVQDFRLMQTFTLQKTTLPGITARAEKVLELIAEIDLRLLKYQQELEPGQNRR